MNAVVLSYCDQHDQDCTFEIDTETEILIVSILRLSSKLEFSDSHYRDREWNYLSRNFKTGSETNELV